MRAANVRTIHSGQSLCTNIDHNENNLERGFCAPQNDGPLKVKKLGETDCFVEKR